MCNDRVSCCAKGVCCRRAQLSTVVIGVYPGAAGARRRWRSLFRGRYLGCLSLSACAAVVTPILLCINAHRARVEGLLRLLPRFRLCSVGL